MNTPNPEASASPSTGPHTPSTDNLIVRSTSDAAKTAGREPAENLGLDRQIIREQRLNWLPPPSGDFSLYVRAYWPKSAVTDGSWTPPPVEKRT